MQFLLWYIYQKKLFHMLIFFMCTIYDFKLLCTRHIKRCCVSYRKPTIFLGETFAYGLWRSIDKVNHSECYVCGFFLIKKASLPPYSHFYYNICLFLPLCLCLSISFSVSLCLSLCLFRALFMLMYPSTCLFPFSPLVFSRMLSISVCVYFSLRSLSLSACLSA